MSYEGNVADLDLIGRLVDLSREHFTGAMRFENDGIIKIIYFKDGDVLSASTNDRTDSIDEMLLRAGKITREHLKQALDKRKENETLGDALLNLGFITRKELTWARRVQVLGIIRSILGWKAGTYTVVSDYLPKREEGTIFPLAQIVIELIVTEPDRARFERLLDSGNATYEREADFDSRFRQLGLNQDAEEIAAAIDGSRSAAEVASTTGKDAFNVYKLLHALELLGMLRRVDRSPRPAPAPAPAMAADEMWSPPVSEVRGVDQASKDDLWTPESWSSAPATRHDPFETSENAPSASSVPSTALPLELSGTGPQADPAEGELVHEPYDPAAVRSQVEENLGGDRMEEGEPRRRGRLGAVAAVVLIAVLGAGGYLYWLRQQGDRGTSGATARSLGAQPDSSGRSTGPSTPAPPGSSGGLTGGGQTASTGTAAAPHSVPSGGASASDRAAPPLTSTVTTPTSTAAPATSTPATSTPAKADRGISTSAAGSNGSKKAAARTNASGRKEATGRPKAPSRAASTTSGGSSGSSEPNETQFEPATATSRARITNVGRGVPGSREPAPSQTHPAPGVSKAPAAGGDALRARYDSMAARHAASVPAGEPYAVQIELVCRTESITRALAAGGDDVWFVPTSFHGQSCYRIFWRHFRSEASAKEAVAAVPAALGAGSRPTVARVP